ncbi:putative methyltransferase PMT17 [Wolffia australiana]
MTKDHSVSPKLHRLNMKKRNLTWVVGVSALCLFFYVLGALQPPSSSISNAVSKPRCATAASSPTVDLDFAARHLPPATNDSFPDSGNTLVPSCDVSFSEYTPCYDQKRSRRFERRMLIYRERHCPEPDEKLHCLIPPPPRYKIPFQWPASRDEAWFDNIPHRELSIEKAVQNWVQVDNDRFRFPGGGTMFPRGAAAYIDDIAALIPLANGAIRTALDTGCGVASWGAYLLERKVLTMSFAPRDTHEAQVQFALERGVPAMIGVMASQRLPYPARAFDMAHCSRCLIPWFDFEGLYLMEVDRVLRPGGYWVLSGPPIRWRKYHKGWERTPEDLRQEQEKIEDLARRLCWRKVIEKDDLAIWQKPIDHLNCLRNRRTSPNFCSSNSSHADVDAAWYRKMDPCISPLPAVGGDGEVAGGKLENWPARAVAVPPRIQSGSVADATPAKFLEDNEQWQRRLSHYEQIAPAFAKGRYRNIMDMNAGLGGLAAALKSSPVWVMNVVPVIGVDTLGVIYERGFIGTYQDWCEAFSTYPRTYDLLHGDGIFSLYDGRCEMKEILLEMDRILRPEGLVVLRDDVDVLVKVQATAETMRWKSRIVDHETGPFNPQKILVAVKTYWTADSAPVQS